MAVTGSFGVGCKPTRDGDLLEVAIGRLEILLR